MEGATGDYRTQFHRKAAAAAAALASGVYDFVFLHVKAVDDTGHDRKPVLKVCRTHCNACWPVFLIGSPVNFADCWIGFPITWHYTGASIPGLPKHPDLVLELYGL